MLFQIARKGWKNIIFTNLSSESLRKWPEVSFKLLKCVNICSTARENAMELRSLTAILFAHVWFYFDCIYFYAPLVVKNQSIRCEANIFLLPGPGCEYWKILWIMKHADWMCVWYQVLQHPLIKLLFSNFVIFCFISFEKAR